MKINKLKSILESLKIPVAYHHFNQKTKVPNLIYYIRDTENFCADNMVLIENATIVIELYSTKKDVKLERQLKDILINNELPYDLIGESFIEEEKVYQTIYEINVINLTD